MMFFLLALLTFSGKYQSFKVAIYIPAWEVEQMADPEWLNSTWTLISNQVKVDKVFIETHRDSQFINASTIEYVKSFFLNQSIEISGGITFTKREGPHRFNSFCYSDPVDQEIVSNLSAFTAEHFDSFILDDFFFTNCRSDYEIEAKGNKTWTEHRMEAMHKAADEFVVGAAKKVNPNVYSIVKYPNWYDHFPGLGFDLEYGPTVFSGIWTGTETRNPDTSQHLQNYLSYSIIRYFSNIAPDRNGGGWIDPYDIDVLDRYAEQLWLTMFAKSKEIALFNYNDLRAELLDKSVHRAPWQGNNTSFDYDTMVQPITLPSGETVVPSTIARAAGYVFETIDQFVYKLGNPVGIKQYKPYNSDGENFLQTFLGMIGIPIEMQPDFPTDQKVVFLTEQAKKDPEIMTKIKAHLKNGGIVVVTSGLLRAIPEKIAEIVELSVQGNILVNDFGVYGNTSRDLLIPKIWFPTNDAWDIINAGRPLSGGTSGTPFLLNLPYSAGEFYVLSIPDDYGNLYELPIPVLNAIRSLLTQDLKFRIEGPSKVSLFLYDNDYLIVENFNDETVVVDVVFDDNTYVLADLLDLSVFDLIDGKFKVDLKPHSYRVFQLSNTCYKSCSK